MYRYESHEPDAAVIHLLARVHSLNKIVLHISVLSTFTHAHLHALATLPLHPEALTQCKSKSREASTQAHANRHQQHGRTSKKGRVVSVWQGNTWTGARACVMQCIPAFSTRCSPVV